MAAGSKTIKKHQKPSNKNAKTSKKTAKTIKQLAKQPTTTIQKPSKTPKQKQLCLGFHGGHELRGLVWCGESAATASGSAGWWNDLHSSTTSSTVPWAFTICFSMVLWFIVFWWFVKAFWLVFWLGDLLFHFKLGFFVGVYGFWGSFLSLKGLSFYCKAFNFFFWF